MKTETAVNRNSIKTILRKIQFGSFFELNNSIYIKVLGEGDSNQDAFHTAVCVLSGEKDTEDYSFLGRVTTIKCTTKVTAVDKVTFDLKDI